MSEALTYTPCKGIKSQALVYFVVEWIDSQLLPTDVQAELWTMYFDGSLMKTGAGAGLLFISPLGIHMRYVIRIHPWVGLDAADEVLDGLEGAPMVQEQVDEAWEPPVVIHRLPGA